MAIKTWDSQKVCFKDFPSQSDPSSLSTTPNSEPKTLTLSSVHKVDRRELSIDGSGPVDLQITLDYSDSFYRAEMSLKPKVDGADDGKSKSVSDSEEQEALNDAKHRITPASVDFSKN
jgi:hypothetical protein